MGIHIIASIVIGTIVTWIVFLLGYALGKSRGTQKTKKRLQQEADSLINDLQQLYSNRSR